MKSFLVLFQILACALLFSSCSDDLDERFQFKKDFQGKYEKDCTANHSCNGTIDFESVLRLDDGDDPFQVNPVYRGNMTVFSFEMKFNDDPLVGDDEILDRVQFEIAPEIDHFYYKDQDLQNIGALFTRMMRGMEKGFYPIREGLFEGYKNADGTWSLFLSFRIVTKGRIPVVVERALIVRIGE